jgi:ADP-ribose pyrophosphatase
MKKRIPEHSILVPKEAKRVFKGILFDVYQWPQKMYDGSTATFEMVKKLDYVQIVGIKDGKIVTIRDEQPHRGMHIHFPGGRTDSHEESWLDAAKREMREETGLNFKNWRMIAVYQPVSIVEQFAVWFLATDFESEQPQKLDGGEKIEVELKSFEELRTMIFGTDSPTMSYAIPLFLRINSMQELLDLPEFAGKEIDD